MVDSDEDAEEHRSREEVPAPYEPVPTDERPGREHVREALSALVGGFLLGFVLPFVWAGIIWTLLGWLLPSGPVTFVVILLIPPVAGLVWAVLQGRERELSLATKVFLVAMLVGWSVCASWVPTLLA